MSANRCFQEVSAEKTRVNFGKMCLVPSTAALVWCAAKSFRITVFHQS